MEFDVRIDAYHHLCLLGLMVRPRPHTRLLRLLLSVHKPGYYHFLGHFRAIQPRTRVFPACTRHLGHLHHHHNHHYPCLLGVLALSCTARLLNLLVLPVPPLLLVGYYRGRLQRLLRPFRAVVAPHTHHV